MSPERRSGPRQGRPDTNNTGSKPTYRGRVIAIVRHRRNVKALDWWSAVVSETETGNRLPVPYAAGGMTLGVIERERAA